MKMKLILLGAAEYIRRFNARENFKISYDAFLVSLFFFSGSHYVVKF